MAKAMDIPRRPAVMEALQKSVKRSSDLDKGVEALGAPALVLNFHLAVPYDLSKIDLGRGVYIPIMISPRRKGSRGSAFYLPPGKRGLVGIFVTETGLALKYLTRESGRSGRTKVGDIYKEEWTTRDGKVLREKRRTIETIDYSTGRATLLATERGGPDDFCMMIFWTLICWCSNDVEEEPW